MDRGLQRDPVQTAVSEGKTTWLQSSHPDPNSDPVCGPPKERKKGGRTDNRQAAKHLQKIRDLFWNFKSP